MMQVIFSKIELGSPPFLTVIQFYSNIDEIHVGKDRKKFQHGQHSDIYLLILMEQVVTESLVKIHVFISSRLGVEMERPISLY